MRIGIDTHAAEQQAGGNASYIRGLVSALVTLDGDETYVLYALEPHHAFYAGLPPNPRVSVRRLWPQTPVLRIPFAIAAASIRDRLDVLHVQYVGPPLHRGAMVVTIHDLAFLHVPESFATPQRWRLRWQTRANARRAAQIIAVSEFSKRDITRAYGIPPERITAIYDAPGPAFAPVTDQSVLAALRQRLGIRHRYVLSVGRMNPRKNVVAIVHAFEHVRPRLEEPTQLVIAGPRDYQSAHLEAAVAVSPCRDDILPVGCIADADLPALFSGAAVFVFPSRFEGFGLPAIEAMACGTPVISSDAAALAEVLGDAAVLVHPEREDALADALERVLEAPDLRAVLVAKGLERARRFTWQAAARQTLEVYYRAAGARSPSLQYQPVG